MKEIIENSKNLLDAAKHALHNINTIALPLAKRNGVISHNSIHAISLDKCATNLSNAISDMEEIFNK